MHRSNQAFWEYVSEAYADELLGTILEYGSHDEMKMGLNDPVLKASQNAKVHIGIDWRAGDNVDVVSLAHEFTAANPADTILSASMLEHDPYYAQSLPQMVKNVKDGGMIALSWGAALNAPHNHEHSPLGQFHNLKAGIVVDILEENGVEINEFLYEGIRYPELVDRAIVDGMGEVCLVAFKGSIPDKYRHLHSIDELVQEDRNDTSI